MSQNPDSGQISPISADELFMQSFPVHPMVAFFIAMPIKKVKRIAAIHLKKDHENLLAISEPVPTTKEQNSFVYYDLPQGMAGRRVMLYLFSRFYACRDDESLSSGITMNADRDTFIRKFGYEYSQRGQGSHPLQTEFWKVIGANFRFKDNKDNTRAGYTGLPSRGRERIVLGEENGELLLNPHFLFNMAFPVDFNHVIGTDKKNRFWNVYMFLIDVLPRIEKGKIKKIPWSLMHDVFYHRPKNLAHFKFYFSKEVKDVITIYPKAKGKVDMSDKTFLKLRYAPPPI